MAPFQPMTFALVALPRNPPHIQARRTSARPWVAIACVAMGDRIGYVRVSTADQNPQLQLDALSAADCLKTYTDTGTGTKADRPQWKACPADLRRGDALIFWKIDRLGRNHPRPLLTPRLYPSVSR